MENDGLSRADIFMLIGHAACERLEGMTESPKAWLDLARRIAIAIGDPDAADRCAQLAAEAPYA